MKSIQTTMVEASLAELDADEEVRRLERVTVERMRAVCRALAIAGGGSSRA